MYQYNIYLIDKVPVIHAGDDNYYILDTGSPVSFSETGEINISDSAYRVSKQFSGADPSYLKRKIDNRLKGLLGMDILAENNFHLDYNLKHLKISRSLDEINVDHGLLINLNGRKTYPEIIISIREERVRAIIDTGAKFSYATVECIAKLDHLSTEEDFSPVLGNLISKRYAGFNYATLGKAFSHDIFYNDKVSRGIGALGFQVLLGYDFMSNQPVTFSKDP